MSVYHYIIGQHSEHALPVGKNVLWRELEGKNFTREELFVAVKDIDARSAYQGEPATDDWINAVVDDLMDVQPPFRVFDNDSRRSEGGGRYIMKSRFTCDAAKPGSCLSDHLFGLSPEDY